MGKKGPSQGAAAESEDKVRRSSKACDNCRKAKCKCTPVDQAEDGSMIGPCAYCKSTQAECTFTSSTKKRGPPKGYLQAVEDRLHRMEALLGGLIKNDDPRAQALLEELITDEEMRQLFMQDCKAAADIGAESKGKHSWAGKDSEPPTPSGNTSVPGIETPTTTASLTAGTSSAPPEPKRRFKADSLPEMAPNLFHRNFDQKLTPGRTIHTAEDDISELADVYGQLSLNEWQEVRYHGRTSGLYLIANSKHFKDFFWRLPNNGVWPYTPVPKPYSDEPESAATDLERHIIQQVRSSMPPYQTQKTLLELFFTYVHPFFPVIYKPWFTALYAKTNTSTCGLVASKDEVPVFLLLCMFSISARYNDQDPNTSAKIPGQHWPAGDQYVSAAKLLMSLPQWGSSRLTSIQGLLLLSYREIGTGAMANAWSLSRSAVAMAQDTGLFREVERWIMPMGARFSHEEKQTRKRTWWGCIIMDRFISAYVGRPQAIFERDYDTLFPSIDEPDEHEQWNPHNGAASSKKTASLSCFKELSELSSLVGHVIAHIYAIRVRVLGQSSEALLQHLDQQLANWYIALPEHLRFTAGDAKVPPPHVLALHAYFFTALILLHRPFIPLKQAGDDPKLRLSLPSHAIATTASTAITKIVSVYEEHYGLQQPIPFLVYFVFSAAVMHIYNVTNSPPDAPLAKSNLSKCISHLDQLSMVWNSAGRQRDLLSGLVNLAEPNNTKMPPPDSPHGQKRSAGSAGIVEEATVPPSAPYTSPQPFPFGQPDANLADTTGFNFQAPPLPELNSGAFPDLFNFMTSAGGTAMMPPPGMLFSQPDSAFSAGEPIGPTHAPQSPSSMWPWLDPTGFPFHPSSHPESHLQTPSYPHMSMPPNNSGLGMSLASSTPSMNTNMSLQHPPLPHPPHPSVKVEQDVLQHTSDLFLQT